MFRKQDHGNNQNGSSQYISYGIFGFACALVIGVFVWSAEPGFLESSPGDAYYNLLVKGFQDGQLNVKRDPDPGLAQLANPYDPVANAPYVWNERYLSYDMSYYEGKLYLYFGVTPALVLFWPYATLTGHYLSQKYAVSIFCSLGFLIAAGLLHQVWRRYFPETSIWVVVSGVIALGFTTGLLEILPSCDVYEVAGSCAFAFTMLALAAIWCALHAPEKRMRWLLLASLAYGLAIGARPSLLFGALILLLPVVQAWREAGGRDSWWKSVGMFGAVVGPLLFIGFGLMVYNQFRFNNSFEFGWRYQLTNFQNNGSRQFSIHYLWFNFRFYFLEPMRWVRYFPFIEAIRLRPVPLGYAGLGTAPYGGILGDCPIVWLALAAPLAWKIWPKRTFLPLHWFAGAAFLLYTISALTLCLFLTASSRYELDFLPALMLLAVIGIFCVERLLASLPSWRLIVRVGWILLLIYSLVFNVLAGFESRVNADFFAGNHLLQSGSVDEAIIRFQKALRLNPEYAGAHAGLGNALLKKGDINGAVIEFQQTLKLEPDFGEIHNNLGFCFLQLGRVDDAIAQYRLASELEPESATFQNAFGNALAGGGHLDEAIAQYKKVLEINPDFAEAHYNLGYCLFQKGLLSESIVQYQKAVEIEPGSADFHNGLGNVLVRAGNRAEAINQYRKALELNSNFPEAYYNLGYLLFQKGSLDEAVSQYQKAIQLQPGFVEAHNSLGDAFRQKKMPFDAIAQYQKAIELQPQFLPAQISLAWTLATWPELSVRNGAQAIALMKKASKFGAGKDPKVLRTLAAAYAEAGQFSDAVSTAKNALTLAESQSDPVLVNELRTEIQLYQSHSPCRSVE